MSVINPTILSEAINRKKSTQAAFVANNACGFVIRPTHKVDDEGYRDINFIGVFEQGVDSLEIEEEIVFQSELGG